MIIEIFKGLIFGALAAVIGYAKQEKPESWQLSKMVKTMIVGALTTGIMRGSGMPISGVANAISVYLASEGIVVSPAIVEVTVATMIVIFADQIVKILVRRTDLVSLFDKFKAFLAQYWSK